MFRNLFLLSILSLLISSCGSNKLEKTNSFKNEDAFKSQQLNEESESETLSIVMSLQDKLDAYAQVAKSKISPEYKKVMLESLQRLKNQQLETRFPKIGDKAKNFKLKDFNGNEIELYDVLKEKAVVLLFYRGSWCPYCNLELKEYKDYYQQFINEGLQILAISPEQPSFTQRFQNKNFFPFPLLFDKKNKLASEYHLTFTLDPELVPIYKQFGIDVGLRNGDGKWEMPVPVTMIISKDKVIKYVFADVDYKNRAEPDSVLAVAKARL
jgi:peroxiredoxin